MKKILHGRWVVLLLVVAAMVQPLAHAQPVPAADGGAPLITSGTATDDAGVDPRAAVTPAAAPTPTEDNSQSVLGSGPPQQAVTPRPDPTPDQLTNLRLLEDEVNGFISRGQGFRTSVNGLLAREHERQLDRLRTGFDRQIQAERASEAEARRRAISVFERFLETYPEDGERTPDVMFRLAELYFDEAAYAKLDADERADNLINERRAQGLPTDDIQPPPVDYRCSVLLYRNIIARFPRFRLSDTTHYLLGWVVKEMSHEDEAISAYKGLVCPSRFHYDQEHAFDLMAPLAPVDQPISCGHLFDILRPRAPQLISPPPPMSTADSGVAMADAAMPAIPPAAAALLATQVAPIPRDYAECEPMRGANGQPSRYAGETWYYIGDYHFDNARDDDGNAMAIAAYQASMRASTRARPNPTARAAQASAIQGAGSAGTQAPAAARAQFDPNLEYGAFWPKSLYKVGWAYFRMQNGYPEALRNFSFLLDFYDFAGAEVAAQGNRSDTIKWIGVIFSESDWGTGPGDDVNRCQAVVESISRPTPDPARPQFDCAGIMRIVSPADPMQVANTRESTAAQRLAPVPGRPSYIPQDRPWTPEAYLELANDYFQQTKYYEAITLYRIFLALYPLHERSPRVAESIARAYEAQRQFDQAINARGRLAQFVEGTEWWNANNSHPDAQRYADLIARNSLHDTAIQHHQNAGQLRAAAASAAGRARSLTGPAQAQAQAEALDKLRQANQEYAAAVQAYTQFITNYPNDEAAYEFRYNRADALYWSRNYQEAARAYSDVRESNENDQYLVASAYMAVKSQEAFIRTEAQARRFDPCLAVRANIPAAELVDDSGTALLTGAQAEACAAAPTGGAGSTQVTEMNIPEPVQTLMNARVSFTQRVPANLDSAEGLRDVVQFDTTNPYNNPPFGPKFAFLNARTLMRYGHVTDAEQRYRAMLERYCNDELISGAVFDDLNNLLVTQNRMNDLEELARAQRARQCTGTTTAARAGQMNVILTNAQFRHALDIYHQAESAPAAQANGLYEQAAHAMEEAVQANRAHPQAALATFYTALAYERMGRFDTATQTYVRIANDFNSTRDAAGHELTGDDLTQRVNILEQSNFRAAVNLERIFDYDSSIRYYGNVVSDQRFANAQDHASHVHDSMASIALINLNLARWEAARTAWQNFIPRAAAGRERSEAEFRVAEIPFRAGNWTDAIRSLQDYLRRTAPSADNAQFRVLAQYNIALANRSLNNATAYRRALTEVVTVFRQSGQQPGSPAAAWAAEALFRDLDDQVTTFTRSQFQRGDAASLRRQIETFKAQLRTIDTAARDVVSLRGGEYSIGALTRQGEAHEYLATQEARIGELLQQSTAEAEQVRRAQAAIAQLRRTADQVERANADAAQRLRDRAQELEDQLNNGIENRRVEAQAAFDQEAAAERSLAVINYATAVNTARTQNIPTPFAARALERMRTDENQPLIATALPRQSVFEYRPGMFDGEAPGANLTQSTPVASPGLATE